MKRKPVCPACGSTQIAEMTWVLSLSYIKNIQEDKAAPYCERIEYTGETYYTEDKMQVEGDKFHCGACGNEFITPDWYEYITVRLSKGNSYQFSEEECVVLVKYHGLYDEEKVATIIDEYVEGWVYKRGKDALAWGWERQ